VTVGDVAAASGLKVADVEEGLRALAADTQATLQVSTAGDVVYAFPSDPRALLLARSWLLRVEPAWNWLKVSSLTAHNSHDFPRFQPVSLDGDTAAPAHGGRVVW